MIIRSTFSLDRISADFSSNDTPYASRLRIGNHDNNTNSTNGSLILDKRFTGVNFDFKITPVASSINYGLKVRLQPVGANGSSFFGVNVMADNRLNTSTTATLIGISAQAHAENTAATAIGGQFSANKGNLNDSDLMIGAVGIAGGYPSGELYIGVRGQITQSFNVTPTPLVEMFHAHLQRPVSGGTINEARGLSIARWLPESTAHVVDTSIGIYADESIDIGDSDRYFIYSLSTSRSIFSGDVEIIDGDRGFVVQDRSVPADRYRIYVDNGTLMTEIMP